MDLFVTGTDTDVGKTVLSGVLVAALGAAYWKPIQTGHLGGRARTDRETVMGWTDLAKSDAPPEAYILDPAISPHLAARRAGIQIDLAAIRRPATPRPLIIEGAGGAMVPINETELMLDLMARLSAPVVVAARTTLGTINHTLLTLEAIRRHDLAMVGVVLVGEESADNRASIEHYGKVPVVGWIPPLSLIDRHTLGDVFNRYFDHSRFES